jgi:acetyl-CoA carboxylase biotin carboxylase subunit
MRRALDGFIIEGIKTNIPMHQKIFQDPEFIAGRLSTHFLEEWMRRTAALQEEPIGLG